MPSVGRRAIRAILMHVHNRHYHLILPVQTTFICVYRQVRQSTRKYDPIWSTQSDLWSCAEPRDLLKNRNGRPSQSNQLRFIETCTTCIFSFFVEYKHTKKTKIYAWRNVSMHRVQTSLLAGLEACTVDRQSYWIEWSERRDQSSLPEEWNMHQSTNKLARRKESIERQHRSLLEGMKACTEYKQGCLDTWKHAKTTNELARMNEGIERPQRSLHEGRKTWKDRKGACSKEYKHRN